MKLSQLAKDPAPMPKNVSKPEDATKKKTEDGDWRGDNEYYQMKSETKFDKVTPLDGHKQQQNVEE